MFGVPYITIGIASYNYGKYLRRAFEAIKRQKFRNFEVLYCDDGSTDESVTIIQSFIDENPSMEIRLIRGQNGGVMTNKNRILENARGTYVMLCDADDWMEDDCLEKLAEAAQKSDADRVVSKIRNVDEHGKIIKIQDFGMHPNKWVEVLHHGAIYKRKIIEDNNLRFELSPDDFCFIEEFNVYSKKTEFVSENLYNWYIHSDSTAGRGNNKSAWKGDQILKGVLRQYNKLKGLVAGEDLQALEAEVIKYYYNHLLAGVIEASTWKEVTQLYKIMHQNIEQAIPDYKKNKYISNRHEKIFRPNVSMVLWGMNLLETVKGLNTAVHLLWCISKVGIVNKNVI